MAWQRIGNFKILIYFCSAEKAISAGVAKLVDALDLGSSVGRRGGSSPFARTGWKSRLKKVAFSGLPRWCMKLNV